MDEGSRLSLIIVIVLLFCAAFFAVTETAFASVSRIRIRTSADRGDARAKKALFVLDNFDRAITTILICTNIIHIAAATLVTVTVIGHWGESAVALSTIITTVVVFFVGEMLPKSIAKKYSERLSLATAGSLCFFMAFWRPLSAVLSALGNFAARFVKADPEITVTEDEIYDIIEDMTEEGSLDEEQSELISSALQFGDTTVESVLTSRVDLAAVDVEDSVEETLRFIRECTHSRLPVYENSIDNIIGILQIRKYIKAYLREGDMLDIRRLLDEPYFVHQSTNIDDLLPVMSRRRLNMAVVTDNYGGTLGIVTVEDILEELVGEIWDEDDVIEEPCRDMGGGVWDVDAEMTVSDVFELMEFDDPREDEGFTNKLMGEWAYEQFAAIPKVGAGFEYFSVYVQVTEMQHNRIMRLQVSLSEGGEET
ncbi:MAG: HlyC/CorC family transporter [Oscillospiraceae bacterium]|nr:HlyC/CorC family transporter [Oscillospiraceae bacterium]